MRAEGSGTRVLLSRSRAGKEEEEVKEGRRKISTDNEKKS